LKTLIRQGLICDGTGTEPFTGDVMIEGDRITGVSHEIQRDNETDVIDAEGCIVTPGFIDIHRHCDKKPLDEKDGLISGKHPYGEVLLRQGITTVAAGNCGISMTPLSPDENIRDQMYDYYAPVLGDISRYRHIGTFSGYMDELERCDLPVNTMALIGLGAVRISVNGFSDTRLSQDQIRICQEKVEEALICGAPGVSIGLMYLPECYSTAEETGEILKPLGRYDRVLCTHIRGEGDSLVKSVEEVIEIARVAGCRLEISHFKSCGIKNWGIEIYKAVRLIDDANRRGQRVTCDFYPYDCGSTTLMSLIPPKFIGGDPKSAISILKTEKGREKLRSALKKEYEDWDNYVISLGWDKAEISAVSREENRWMLGKNITEIAREGRYADEVEAVSELLVSENGSVAIIIKSMDQRDVDEIAKLPYSAVISDAIYAENARPHPRMYGAFPRVISDYVVKRKILSLQGAVSKMTSIPAKRMKISDRGCIREGMFADLNVFKLDEFRDTASYEEPEKLACGIKLCFVNGRKAVENDKILNSDLGRLIKL
jgi:N-acyl-D-amino-acid deacylase